MRDGNGKAALPPSGLKEHGKAMGFLDPGRGREGSRKVWKLRSRRLGGRSAGADGTASVGDAQASPP